MSEKDAGFCSGEDDIDHDIHSPTDASEDSIEVKVTPISPRNKHKRKCTEPRKVPLSNLNGPLKKRIRHEHIFENKLTDEQSNSTQNPFRPWSISDNESIIPIPPQPNSTQVQYHPVYGYQQPPLVQDEPLALVKIEKSEKILPEETSVHQNQRQPDPGILLKAKEFARFPSTSTIDEDYHRVPPHPGVTRSLSSSSTSQPSTIEHITSKFNVDSLLKQSKVQHSAAQQKEHRNYKNMTRERRIEANARERTRVHTISAAFDTLRRAIPAYSHNQKLSKLSVLRIACSYILTLSRVAGKDYSADQSEPPLANCVDLVSRTIQTEGKLRKKKDE